MEHIFKDFLNMDNFFSIAFDWILLDAPLPYDLYVNSSKKQGKEKFVRIFPLNGVLSQSDVQSFRKKYHQLYILEDQRNNYLRALVKNPDATDVQKTAFIKDSAINYLDKIFDKNKEITNEFLIDTLEDARESVESMVDTLKDYNISGLQKLIGELSFHDFYTYDHSINVSMYNISILRAINPNEKRENLVTAGLGGLFHDLGKIKIPTHIINKASGLSEEDFAEIKKHPGHGKELLNEQINITPGVDLDVIRRIIFEHHENFNGTGYPDKLAAKDIHLYARITAISDFYDAVTTKRAYHNALGSEDAIQLMSKAVGKKIDPEIFNIFCKQIDNLVLQGKTTQKLPDDFDPCQPQNTLPLEKDVTLNKIDNELFKKDKDNFGKIKSSKFDKE